MLSFDLNSKKIEGKIKIGGAYTIKERIYRTNNYEINYRVNPFSTVGTLPLGGNANNLLNLSLIHI